MRRSPDSAGCRSTTAGAAMRRPFRWCELPRNPGRRDTRPVPARAAAMNPRLPDPLAPQSLSHARSLPAGFYLGAASAERDRDAVFARSWQLVGHEGALADVGDHLVADIAG